LKVFFVIPFYNDAQLIGEALKSLLDQTYPHWEAVVLDDSVNPEQARLAKELVEKLGDSRIRYSKNEQNIGMSRNMNQGLSLGATSGCDAITILHADDVLDPDYARMMTETMAQHPEANALFCETRIIDGRGNSKFSFPDWYKKLLLPPKKNGKIFLQGAEGIQVLIPGNFIFFPTLCFSVKKLGADRFQENLKMVPDFDMTLRMLITGGTLIGLYSKPLYYYRRHENNSTNLYNKNLLRFREERDLYLNLATQLEQRGWSHLAIAARRLKIVKLNLIFNMVKSLVQFDIKSAKNFLNFLIREV
jgi:glycosyltransferase involved in cell wall biosynthesis